MTLSVAAPPPALQTFVRDGGTPIRAKAQEIRRAELRSSDDGLEACFTLWRRARQTSGWIATVEIRRDADGALRRFAHSGDQADEVLDALESWRPSWPDDAASALEARAAQARLERFYLVGLGEVLNDWC